MSTEKPRPDAPLEPATREHGVFGYDQNPVGGFGEDYSHQVAHGSEPDAAADLPPNAADQQLEKAVRVALAQAHIDAADLRVEVENAQVTLYGTVRRPSEKSDLEARARAVPGVVAVTSRLTELRSGSA